MADSFSSIGASFGFHATMKRIRAAVTLEPFDSHLANFSVILMESWAMSILVDNTLLIIT